MLATPLQYFINMNTNLYKIYTKKSNQELLDILSNHSSNNKDVVKTATQILNERNVDYPQLETLEETDSKIENNQSADYKKYNVTVRGVATYLLLNGLFVVAFLIDDFFNVNLSSISELLLLLLFSLFYIIGIIAAVQLFRKQISGLVLGIIALYPLSIYLQTGVFGFHLRSILDFNLEILPPISVNLNLLDPGFQFNFGSDQIVFGFNLVAAIALIFLLEMYVESKEKGEFYSKWF